MIFSVIIYVIKMQIKHLIISNLIIGCYYCGNARWYASIYVMVRYNCVKMTLKSNLSLCVARRPATRGSVRNVNGHSGLYHRQPAGVRSMKVCGAWRNSLSSYSYDYELGVRRYNRDSW